MSAPKVPTVLPEEITVPLGVEPTPDGDGDGDDAGDVEALLGDICPDVDGDGTGR